MNRSSRGDMFSLSQDSSQLQTHLSACLSLSRDTEANVLLRHAYQRNYKLKDRKAYEQRFTAVLEALESESRWRNMHVTAAIFAWLGGLQEDLSPDPGTENASSKAVRHVLSAQEWIQQRLGDNVSIAEWSAACGLNPDYFSRMFKAHTGMSPKTWLIEARLQRAARMLAYKESTVEQVAASCGFNCPFHFSRSFKRRFGLPPASYRSVRLVRGFVDS
ncbi:MAG: AraC family transcriptional regulator [Roseovarius sp.]